MTERALPPVARIELTLASGEVLVAEWSMGEPSPRWMSETTEPPLWITGRGRRWDHPQDPVTITGSVMPGHEDAARELVA